MARPRSIPDQTIIAAAYDLLMEEGVAKLTFERLSTRVGLVPGALVRRFKTKQQLLLEVDHYALELTNAKVTEAIEKTSSSVEALVIQFTTEKAFASTIERFVNGEEFLLMDLRDKNLYTNYQRSFEHRHQQIVKLLQQAQTDGELAGIGDVDKLARHLELIMHGAGHVWAMTQASPIETYIRQHIQFALQPYRRQK